MKLPDHIQKIDNKPDTTVFVAMSGGVDSSVSAALLQEAGFDVVGFFMSVWQPPFLDCSMGTERQDAIEVAAELGIPFKTIDLADAYKNRVVDCMIQEYAAGRTPNPDVMCNGEIKFGAFYEAAMQKGADYIATGHYARLRREAPKNKSQTTKTHLLRGVDEHKDQSYFLWQLGQKQLQDTLFPVGHMEKSQVRETAKEFDIPVADKDDSQGLCFLGEVDMQEFLQEFIDTEEGEVLNEHGTVIGKHRGSELYTIGQRRGFEVTDKEPDSGPWYVIDKDTKANTITVSENNTQTGPVYNGKKNQLTNTNWITEPPQDNDEYQAQIRYNQPARKCKVDPASHAATQGEEAEGSGRWTVEFEESLRAVAAGQSCVVYDNDVCLGGGIISEVIS